MGERVIFIFILTVMLCVCVVDPGAGLQISSAAERNFKNVGDSLNRLSEASTSTKPIISRRRRRT